MVSHHSVPSHLTAALMCMSSHLCAACCVMLLSKPNCMCATYIHTSSHTQHTSTPAHTDTHTAQLCEVTPVQYDHTSFFPKHTSSCLRWHSYPAGGGHINPLHQLTHTTHKHTSSHTQHTSTPAHTDTHTITSLRAV